MYMLKVGMREGWGWRNILPGVLVFKTIILVILAVQFEIIDTSRIRQAFHELVKKTGAEAGPLGPLLHGVLHAFAIVLCFPGTIMFEIAGGFMYGFFGGVALVVATKAVAASLCFAIGRYCARGYVRKAMSKYPAFQRLSEGAAQDGWRFVLLARLSPIPSWANNYGLSLTDLSYWQFLPATVIGGIPTITQNVFVGTTVSAIADAKPGQNSALQKVLLGVSVVVTILLVAKIRTYATSGSMYLTVKQEEDRGMAMANIASLEEDNAFRIEILS